MEEKIEKFPIVRINKGESTNIEDAVVRELPLTIFLNSQELVTLLCTPESLKYLALGFLFSEGLLRDRDEIKRIAVDDEKGRVWVETKEDKDFVKVLLTKRLITSGCGRGATFYNVVDATSCEKINSEMRISPQAILNLANRMQGRSKLYRSTGGVHSAALCDGKSILIFNEDIGRHNAIDKVFGEAILKEIQTDNKIIITSGRVSSEILLKVVKRNVPIIVSISAPTNLAVRLAAKLGVTLIGFARGKRMNIYANEWRILAGEPKGGIIPWQQEMTIPG